MIIVENIKMTIHNIWSPWFQVELLNPSRAEVGIGSTIEITIQHSDQAYGVFQFEPSSLEVIAIENSDSGYDSVFLQVIERILKI